MELHTLDLNLLLVFQHLITQRRVGRVAEQLGVTQPAVSNALAKLRRHFQDDLFVRTPHGMAPTPFAEQLAGPVGEALALLQAGLNTQRQAFDPARAERSVTLGMTDIGEIYFLPTLLDRLRREAPGVRLSTVRNTAVNLREALEAGQVDLAIGLLPQLQAGFFQRRLFSQRYVCLMRQGHPLAAPGSGAPSLTDYTQAEHLVVVSAGTGHGQVDELLARQGITRQVRLTVPHFVGLGHLLQHSDLLATVPERLADALIAPFHLTKRPHPAPLPEVDIHVFWHARYHRDPANQWLRGVVFGAFGEGGTVSHDSSGLSHESGRSQLATVADGARQRVKAR